MHLLSRLPKKMTLIMRVDISRQVMAAGIDISPESHVSGLPNSKRRTYRLRCDLY